MSPSFLAPLILTLFGVQITCSNGNTETEQCAKPTGPGINSLSLNKDFYDPEESVKVTCAPGYHSVSHSILCEFNGTHSHWDVPDPCIAFHVNVTHVTPTSISLQWECEPGPCQSHWDIRVYYEAVGQNLGWRPIFTWTEGVTVSELQFYTEYNITISGHSLWKQTELWRRTIRTEESVPGKPDFTQYPIIIIINNNNNTLKWRLSDTHGAFTGYQLNMVAWKETTLIKEESHWLTPNVTEYRIPMEADTSYMVTVRGLTATGPGGASVWISGNLEAAGASDSYVRVSLVLKPLFLIILILVLLCFTVKEKWEQKRTGEKRHQRRTERGGSIEMVPPVRQSN